MFQFEIRAVYVKLQNVNKIWPRFNSDAICKNEELDVQIRDTLTSPFELLQVNVYLF